LHLVACLVLLRQEFPGSVETWLEWFKHG